MTDQPHNSAARWDYSVTLHADRTEVVAVCDCNWKARFYDFTKFPEPLCAS